MSFRSRPLPRSGEPECSRDAVLFGEREALAQMRGLVRIHPRAETVLFRFHESAHDTFDPVGRLALAEDHFRKRTQGPADEVKLGETEVGEERADHLRARSVTADQARAEPHAKTSRAGGA